MDVRRPIRVANFSGFYGDRAAALAEVLAGDVDVVTGDYLAEVTMLVLAKNRAKDPAAGYAAGFLRHLAPVVATLRERGVKLVTNAGGLAPHALAEQVRALARHQGHELAVAVVDGDDVLDRVGELPFPHLDTGAPLASWGHRPLTANAYLGGFGIARALAAGADVVICGRVTDASLTVGPAAWWHRWTPADLDALAGAVVAGHVIECGTQATGGNYSSFGEIADLSHPGFPIAEIAADGSSVLTKHPGTAGAVTVGTVTAQLLYEVGPPGYVNPDVVAWLDTAQVRAAGPDRVAVGGVRGTAPPATTKVAVTALGGWRTELTCVLTGLDVAAKAELLEQEVRKLVAADVEITGVDVERIGSVAEDPATQGAASCLLRIVVRGSTEAAVGRRFSAAVVELGLATYPGFHLAGGLGRAQSFGTYWPGLVPQAELAHRVTHADGTMELVHRPAVADAGPPAPTRPPAWSQDGGVTRRALGTVADARSGDKGGDANVGVWVRDDRTYAWLAATLTVDRFRELVGEARELAVDRYLLPNLRAVNFVVHGLLGEGATASTRLDNQAKALGEYLLARHVDVPDVLVANG